ncbi:MAG: hypothetical protein LBF75_01780 [Treponema sp.]|nr:hypothetical protein [Treponema sp.]
MDIQGYLQIKRLFQNPGIFEKGSRARFKIGEGEISFPMKGVPEKTA